MLFNGASSELWFEGVSQDTGSTTSVPDGMTWGAANIDAAYFTGDMAEILIYDSDLSDADKNEIGAYLATKFALSWTTIT